MNVKDDDNGSRVAIMFHEAVVGYSEALFSEFFWLNTEKHENRQSDLLDSEMTFEPGTSRIQSRVLPTRPLWSVA
jgi:hypothetical protein